jgi:hypothetical protein
VLATVGIAHDFNNLLTAILGNLSLLKASGAEEELLAETRKAITRARGLTEQLLTFSRGGTPVKRLVDLARLLRDTVCFALAGSNVQADFRIAPDLLEAELDEGQFAQVINNLVINARQAMPEGGRLGVEAANEGREAGRPRAHHFRRGEGIAPAPSPIFDPYFSTKQNGKDWLDRSVLDPPRPRRCRIEVESEPAGAPSLQYTCRPPLTAARRLPHNRRGSCGGCVSWSWMTRSRSARSPAGCFRGWVAPCRRRPTGPRRCPSTSRACGVEIHRRP